MMDKFSKFATRCAEAGLPVLPVHRCKAGACTCGDPGCPTPGQHPRTENGVGSATTSPGVIRQFAAKWPNAKIGIATGHVVALETCGKVGRDNMRNLAALHGAVSRTVTMRHGDRRLRFLKVGGDAPLSGNVAAGIRIIGRGDFIVAPSKLAATGTRFFEEGRAPGEVGIAYCPDWLLRKLTNGGFVEKSGNEQVETQLPIMGTTDTDRDNSAIVATAEGAVPKRRRGRPPKSAATSPAESVAGPAAADNGSAAGSLDIFEGPAGLNRRPLTLDEERQLSDIKSFFDCALFKGPWDSASPVLQYRVLDVLRAICRGRQQQS